MLVVLLAGTIVFCVASKAAEENREYAFWSDFKDINRASASIICRREGPTQLATKAYTNRKELWEIIIINLSHKDIARHVTQFLGFQKGVLLNSFARFGNTWKRSSEVTAEEWGVFIKTHPISPEEAQFLNMCLAQKQFT
ncbi:hypothetical protein A3C77_03000 [Candidatus Giovannonibacteria bacterium RIFCSPHIGHO2_02_FULL_45_13]|uniref:Uncharacterized protein n=1 Tax=Candidatus Giovannonibacteria bacterium RIFCSPHIGHO2_01_FULL_45_23 TaxID=1798325 RepID=A0A1F5VF92_9BACT|nr:MAG: hypothetical protein A2834_00290 [Candidatus Giovannonibacteria bacterium RIFCSPHIGHO2_01_FULL_45_23]OGF76488.1 MAG: hypothetical protein A3C77_03000 [Candidatus Giovannonibacteria bacterium RIFCSPHIGHO2_02_FULL_45_13]